MKKFTSIAVVGLAAAIGFTSVAIADATIYGRVTAGAVHVDNDMENSNGSWDFGSNKPGLATRVGFKGDQDLGNGMSAGFQIERGVDATFGKRHNLVYLSGGWGKLTLGNQNNPFMNARNWDQTYFYGGNWGHGAGYRHEGINYSMSNGPFSLNIMAMATSGNTQDAAGEIDASGLMGTTTNGVTETSNDDSIDGWILHAGYDFGVAAVNVAHQADNKDFDITTAASSTQGDQAALATGLNNDAVDLNASRSLTAIGVNGSVGAMDWYLAYQTTELNAGGNGYEDNDVDSVGGFLGFNMSDKDTVYVYYVAHSGDRASAYDDNGTQRMLGEDYTETIVGYSRDMGPGLRFIGEYAAHDHDLDGSNVGSDRSRLALAIRYVF
ncbi:MAG: porin [Gammaproteobacteria bacterium]|nr:porin [Gammaproteobacteria bacterium]